MLTLGPTPPDPALTALDASGRVEAGQLATFDLSPAVLRATCDGNMLSTVDQQRYCRVTCRPSC